MDWEECNKRALVKETKIDENLIKSLLKTSENKLKSFNRLELDSVTASTKVSLFYDCLRELLEALAIKNKYKIYNHECFASFLKEILEDNFLAFEFDRFRKIRNGINYYGKEISIDNVKTLIREMQNVRNKILEKYFKND